MFTKFWFRSATATFQVCELVVQPRAGAVSLLGALLSDCCTRWPTDLKVGIGLRCLGQGAGRERNEVQGIFGSRNLKVGLNMPCQWVCRWNLTYLHLHARQRPLDRCARATAKKWIAIAFIHWDSILRKTTYWPLFDHKVLRTLQRQLVDLNLTTKF